MGTTSRSGGQRSNLASSSGKKQRSPTSHGQTGSRVDPSHTTEHTREVREKKTVRQAKSVAPATPAKPSPKNPNLTAKQKHKQSKKK
jgi:hypothetical protein